MTRADLTSKEKDKASNELDYDFDKERPSGLLHIPFP